MLKSAATSSLREYSGSEIFDSGISRIKRQIAFMATLSLYKSGTIFRMRPVSNQSVEPVLRPRYAPPKIVRFSYRKCPVERFYRNAHARHYVRATSQRYVTLELDSRQYGWRQWCQTAGKIPPWDFFPHALIMHGIPPLFSSLASQDGGRRAYS